MAVIDLSQLPAPQIVDVPDFETLLAERKAEFVALHPKDEQEAVIRTLELESEPATKLLQENAYRELLLRQRINEAAQAVMVAYAMGGDLDQLAANYNVTRLTVTPADNDAVPPVAAVMESDEALRLRVPAAFEGLSVAGPTAAYEFHARSADGRVADASATSPAPAEVVLTVLSREGDGTAEKDLLDVVEKALNSENVRPVADRLTVRSAEIIPYRVEATIFLYPGPEAEPVMAAAKASLQKYIASQTRLGRDIRRSAIFAALHVEGVQRVDPNFSTTVLNALAGKQPLDNTLTNLSGKDVAGLLAYLGLGEAAKRNVGTGENQIPDMTSFASGDGWMKLPNGKILQYGRGAITPTLSTQTMRITFSIPFPKKVDCAMLTHSGDGGAPLGAGRGFVMTAEGPTLTGFNSAYRTASTSSTVSMNYSWWAVGE